MLVQTCITFPSQGRGANQEGEGETREASQEASREREGNAGGHEKKVITQLAMTYKAMKCPCGVSQEKTFNITNDTKLSFMIS